MLLVDTNILIDVLQNDPAWVSWSIKQLRAQAQIRKLIINPVIYTELSTSFTSIDALDETLEGLEMTMMEIPKPALFLAGKAFIQYRRQGGTKTNVLADFFIGAHAAVNKITILTRDTLRYRSYFPTVKLIAPPS